ncbi:MAG TPA: hypothetical protein PLS51_05585 [Flavobacterium sp.]|jgi:hypothetical protein|nr:hypothetical protein [Flavobacterium sp.]HPJ10082.1 hypothetical protein [Flavobacterium sp.]
MKNLYVGLFIMLSYIACSQPVMTSTDIIPFSWKIYNLTTQGLTPGGSGANQIWNFESVAYEDSSFLMQSVPVNSTPFVENFPQTNFVQKLSATIDSFVYENYTLSQITSSGIETFATTNSEGIENNYSPDTQFSPLPLTYNLSWNNTYHTTEDETPLGSNNTYDAYGTLITPFGTFTDVIRVKYVHFDGEIQYNWYQANPYKLLMIGKFADTNTSQDLSFLDNVTLASKAFIQNSIVIYPNPTSTMLHIASDSKLNFDKFIVSDSLGKTVLNKRSPIRLTYQL